MMDVALTYDDRGLVGVGGLVFGGVKLFKANVA